MKREAVAGILAPVFGTLLAILPASAEQLRGKIPHLAEGKIVEANTYPWSAIGKLNNGLGGSCTAVMVSPRYALTAAHCLYFRRTGRFLPPRSFHLVLGYQKQQYRDHFLISAFYIPATYDPNRAYETLASDWALLSIDRTATSETRPLNVQVDDQPIIKSTLMTGGYSHRTPYAMTADQSCGLIGRSHDRSFLFDSCKAPSGFSGAPLIVADADGTSYSIAGIHVANQVYKTNEIAIAIPLEKIWPEIKQCVEDHQCEFQHVATGRDPTAAEVFANRPVVANRDRQSSTPLCAANDPSCKTTLAGQQ